MQVELVNDNLYEWHVRLHRVDPDSALARDMAEQNVTHILLNINFPDNFPFSPPFMRVVEPRIEKGFVMDGGAICMELLTPRGWASAYTVEALLMQFSASLVKGQGRIAKNVKSGSKEFSRYVHVMTRTTSQPASKQRMVNVRNTQDNVSVALLAFKVERQQELFANND